MAFYDKISLKVVQNGVFVVKNSTLNDKNCNVNGILSSQILNGA